MTAIQTGIYLLIRGEIKPKGRMGEDIFFPFYYLIGEGLFDIVLGKLQIYGSNVSKYFIP